MQGDIAARILGVVRCTGCEQRGHHVRLLVRRRHVQRRALGLRTYVATCTSSSVEASKDYLHAAVRRALATTGQSQTRRHDRADDDTHDCTVTELSHGANAEAHTPRALPDRTGRRWS